MMLNDLHTFYEYNEWANSRFVDILAGLEPARLTTPLESSFPSVLDTLAHMVAAEWVWLKRWTGHSPTAFPEWLKVPDLQELRTRLSQVEKSRGKFLHGLTIEDLETELSYRTLNGEPHMSRLHDLLVHVVNHSTYHRGQLTTLLRQVGAKPPATDYILFLRLRSGA